jgi:hypothetical protein
LDSINHVLTNFVAISVKAQLNGDTTEIKEKEKVAEVVEDDADKEIFYDKEVSFFDNISCEAIERSKG